MLGQLHDSDLKLLRVFHTIARCGGFTAAQAELNSSPSTISTQMSLLESRLGMTLCQRGHAGFQLTDQGIQILKACEKLFASIEEFKAESDAIERKSGGEIRIGVVNNTISLPDFTLHRSIASFISEVPDVRLNLYVGIETELESRVLDGRLHLSFVTLHRKINGLRYEKYLTEEHLLYCGNGHPLFSRPAEEVSIDDLEKSDYVDRDFLESAIDLKPPFESRIAATSVEMEGIAQLILSGHYIGYLPVHYAKNWVDSGRMKPLLPATTRQSTAIYMITRTGVEHPKYVKSFFDHLNSIKQS